jgi:hypothetical protein
MKILIEEYRYRAEDVKTVLKGIDALESIEGYVSVNYVGYFYNTDASIHDCVFILPKILLENKEGQDLVFGKYRPEDIIHLDKDNPLTRPERDFIYEFSVWIYRSIVVFHNDKRNDSSIVYHKKIAEAGRGRQKLSNTFLDVLLSLLQFHKENRQFFFFVLRNLHSGLNKINWNRTISTTRPVIQDDSPVYLNPVNKKRQINFDEELLVIFFSILNYISEQYGFKAEIDCNFTLITGRRFETYLKGMGKVRLHQIKYKYFSDKALLLWELCYAFFDTARQIQVSTAQKEYLLVKNFNIVFEAIIDELIGDNPLPDGMQKQQEDGKIVDHLFTAKSLIQNDQSTYYIGDSKYYKIGHEVGKTSVYKQYTYARNVIQWNVDIFNSGQRSDSGVKLRDDMTEGYNIIPNFFISATMNEQFDYSQDGIQRTDRSKNRQRNTQFSNRLFDRDTLLLFHYDVNFLFVLSLYARNNGLQKAQWKEKIRDRFKTEIQDWLQEDYEFYAMQARPGVDAEEYIQAHFKSVIGKIHSPYADKGVYSLALEASDRQANEALKAELGQSFYLVPCKLGENPAQVIQAAVQAEPEPIVRKRKDGVLMVMMEKYAIKSAAFLNDGELAIGLKETADSQEILDHLPSIGYILFHTRNDAGKHLFALSAPCELKTMDEVDHLYRNIKTADRFLHVKFQNDFELMADTLHPKNKECIPTTRYDSQYATIEELKKES